MRRSCCRKSCWASRCLPVSSRSGVGRGFITLVIGHVTLTMCFTTVAHSRGVARLRSGARGSGDGSRRDAVRGLRARRVCRRSRRRSQPLISWPSPFRSTISSSRVLRRARARRRCRCASIRKCASAFRRRSTPFRRCCSRFVAVALGLAALVAAQPRARASGHVVTSLARAPDNAFHGIQLVCLASEFHHHRPSRADAGRDRL